MPENESRSRVDLAVSWTTLVRIAAACLLAYWAVRLQRFILLLLLALVIALAFRPLMQWSARRGWPRWLGALLCGLILLGSTAVVFGILIPTVSNQVPVFLEKLPAFKDQLLKSLPESGRIRDILNEALSRPPFSDPTPALKYVFAWGSAALEHLIEFFLVLIIAFYFVLDGERVYHWLVAFFPEHHRQKMDSAADEITSVVGHYIAGNLFTSVLCAIYAFAVLQLLHVPDAALMAILAGIFDLLPIIGFFLFTIPAVLLALTVSPATAVLVAVLYGAYHLLENYVIVPKVYGNRLRLSTLTVLICCLAAGLVAGVIGVIVVLPLVASYPVVERIWLRPYLERDTVQEHQKIDEREHGKVNLAKSESVGR
jgi:predicted PurR-regulated permease PerM